MRLALAVEDAEPSDLLERLVPALLRAFRPGRAPRGRGVGRGGSRAGRPRRPAGLAGVLFTTTAAGPVPERHWPDAVYALPPDGLVLGRRCANPAVAAHARLRLVRGPWSYRTWLDSVTVRGGGGACRGRWRALDSSTVRRRDAVAGLAERRGDAAVLARVAAAAAAVGIPIPPPPYDVDVLAELVSNPWESVLVPGLWPIDVARLAGPPGPETLICVGDECAADLYHLKESPG